MQVHAFAYDLDTKAWSVPSLPSADSARTLVLAFGAPEVMQQADAFAQLARAYPRSIVLGCSSAGEIHGTTVRDRSVAVTVTRFDKTDLVMTSMDVAGPSDSFSTGQTIAKKLSARPGLRGVLVLSEGLNVNGSELVRGLNSVLDESIVVSGGLSGDGSRFKQTWVAVGPKVKSNVVVAVGFYGDFIQIGHGSKGGWDKFGPERVVTKSDGNVLYELDGKPALALYKEYLGDKAKGLPASGLLFPLSLRASSKDDKALVRTLLAVDHDKSSLTFAGDIPKGYLAQLMKADFDRLIGGASLASSMAKDNGAPAGKDSLVVAISCVGRRLVLGDRIEEEVEAVLDALPKNQQSHITGFYSYGEISPYAAGHCDLHNQTMTLTVFSESPTPLARKKAPMRTGALPKAAPLAAVAIARAPAAPPAAEPPPPPAASSPPPTSTASSPRFDKRTGPVTRAPLQPSGATGATVQKAKHGDVTLLTITGRLTEAFKGESLGRELHGTVAIDLAGVERITSFGVREWLSMLGAMQDVRRLYLLRASEAVANQLSMIRKFSGSGQIVSFFAPYLCGACGEQFELQLDCERDADAIREGNAPDAQCPRCDGKGHFDDDARSYFAFAAPHLLTPVPEDIRAVQDRLDAQPASTPREAVDKTIEGNQTRVRVNSKLGANIRWKRVLDGIEGSLILDLGGVTGVEPAGLSNLEQALGGLGPEVAKVVLERVPSQMLERLAQTGVPPRVSIASAMIDAECQTCTVYRSALVSIHEQGDALAAGELPRIHCKRCNAELRIEPANRTLAFLRAHMTGTTQKTQASLQAPLSSTANVPLSLGGMSVSGRHPTDDVAAPASAGDAANARRNRTLTFAVAALGVAVVALGALQLSRADVTPASGSTQASSQASAAAALPTKAKAEAEAAPAASAPSNAWMQNVELPPAWVERTFVVEGTDIFVVGKGELAATPEQAMGYARSDAIVRMLKQIQQELAGSTAGDFLQSRTREPTGAANEAIANRYLKQFGTTASPERVDAALRKREAGVEGFARYKLPRTTYQQVVASYRDAAFLQGMTVGKFFPLLETTMHTDGDIIVLGVLRGRNAAEQGVRPGDIVLAIGSRPVTGTDAFNKIATEEWASTPLRGNLSVDMESAGARRTIRFFKPAPPGQ